MVLAPDAAETYSAPTPFLQSLVCVCVCVCIVRVLVGSLHCCSTRNDNSRQIICLPSSSHFLMSQPEDNASGILTIFCSWGTRGRKRSM